MTKTMKLCGIAILIAVTATPLCAQGIEFSGGVNFTKLSGDDIQNAARNTGLNFGLDVLLPVGPIGLTVGADWSQKGVEETIGNATSVIDLSYVELPVHLRFPIVGAGPVRLNLVLGPTLGINAGCKVSIDAAAAQNCEDLATDPFSAKRLEWAGATGLGVSFALGGLAYAGVDLKYSFGLSNVSEGSSLDAKNRTFSLTSHLGFGLF